MYKKLDFLSSNLTTIWPKFNLMSYSVQAVGSLVPMPALSKYLASLSAQNVVLALPVHSVVIE